MNIFSWFFSLFTSKNEVAGTNIIEAKPQPTPKKPEQSIRSLAKSLINVFEMGSTSIKYSDVYIYNDGPNQIKQYTLSFGITEFGNMKKLIEKYIVKKGKYANQFSSYVNKIGKTPLVGDSNFKQLLIKSSKEDILMRDSQDEIYDEAYVDRAEKWFKENGFKTNLAFVVILDSFIHSGSILGFLRERFSESPPAGGGDEKKWINSYVQVRHSWLAGHSNRILRNTIYRTSFFKSQINKNNWEFNCPITAEGVKIC